jgi:hypothetical protein
MTDLPPEPPGEARRIEYILRQIAALPGTGLLRQLRAMVETPPRTPQHRENLVHALRNAAARIDALADELDKARDVGDAT